MWLLRWGTSGPTRRLGSGVAKEGGVGEVFGERAGRYKMEDVGVHLRAEIPQPCCKMSDEGRH